VKLRLLPITLILSTLGACQAATAPDAAHNASRLLESCGETGRLLGQMKAAESSFRYDQSGNARISKNLWTSIPASMQDALINAIAYQAVCASGQPGEQVVTVRSSEASEILAQETVTEFDR